ncbi:MAG: glycosyltransferase family 2 protein [Desulfovibrionaceae bacterium]|nr:glycosyltransferase family 2 protein [Desulfovibrionaceae bacterium]
MVSIIIPVYNKWSLTKQCLYSIASTSNNESIEVLIFDNASSDETKLNCAELGNKLFGDKFKYIREETNKNYAGANNIAASYAHGEYLFLLNNDTILLDGWLDPLRKTILEDSNIGAVTPLLLYPKNSGIYRVQHTGVAVSLNHAVTHLYEGFPHPHPLLNKRRYFQIITGAALFIPRKRFIELGGFNENFKNGFEDVEFCYRLSQAGYRQTVAYDSVVIHYGSQSEGRSTHNDDNSILCNKLCPNLDFDEAKFWRDDDYYPIISPWGLQLLPSLSPKKEFQFLSILRNGNLEELEQAVINEPYWFNGGILLANKYEKIGNLQKSFDTYLMVAYFNGTPDILIPFVNFLKRHEQTNKLSTVLNTLQEFKTTPEIQLDKLYNLRSELIDHDNELITEIDRLISDNNNFFKNTYPSILNFIS